MAAMSEPESPFEAPRVDVLDAPPPPDDLAELRSKGLVAERRVRRAGFFLFVIGALGAGALGTMIQSRLAVPYTSYAVVPVALAAGFELMRLKLWGAIGSLCVALWFINAAGFFGIAIAAYVIVSVAMAWRARVFHPDYQRAMEAAGDGSAGFAPVLARIAWVVVLLAFSMLYQLVAQAT